MVLKIQAVSLLLLSTANTSGRTAKNRQVWKEGSIYGQDFYQISSGGKTRNNKGCRNHLLKIDPYDAAPYSDLFWVFRKLRGKAIFILVSQNAERQVEDCLYSLAVYLTFTSRLESARAVIG